MKIRISDLAESLISFVEDMTKSYSAVLLEMAVRRERKEKTNQRHPTNFLSEIDCQLNDKYKAYLQTLLPAFVYASEEEGPDVWPPGFTEMPEYLAIVDPLDTSELAVRGLNGYTHITLYSLCESRPIVTVIGDMFHYVKLFCAYRTEKGNQIVYLKTKGGKTYPLVRSSVTEIETAIVTNYLMPPLERFIPLANEQPFIQALGKTGADGKQRGRIGIDFGSVGLCHVAAGFTDAMVEFAKGFALWDLFPGQHVLQAAGGIVLSLEGKELGLDLHLQELDDIKQIMNRRQTFIAAGDPCLARKIVGLFSHKAE